MRTQNKKGRPLLNRDDRETYIAELMEKRAPFYAAAELTIDTSQHRPQEVTDQIIAYLRQGGNLRGRS